MFFGDSFRLSRCCRFYTSCIWVPGAGSGTTKMTISYRSALDSWKDGNLFIAFLQHFLKKEVRFVRLPWKHHGRDFFPTHRSLADSIHFTTLYSVFKGRFVFIINPWVQLAGGRSYMYTRSYIFLVLFPHPSPARAFLCLIPFLMWSSMQALTYRPAELSAFYYRDYLSLSRRRLVIDTGDCSHFFVTQDGVTQVNLRCNLRRVLT